MNEWEVIAVDAAAAALSSTLTISFSLTRTRRKVKEGRKEDILFRK
jgi:hypothetical protein